MMTSYAGLFPSGDLDLGVPVGQAFSPLYLFKPDGSRATRPVIEKWPETISHGGHFDIVVEGDPSRIASVVLLRSDHNAHSLTTGDRYVKMAFHTEGCLGKKGVANSGQQRCPRGPSLFDCQ